MEPNKMITDEEIIETTTEEIVKASSKNNFKAVAGFGLGILAGIAICKLAKPLISKIKMKKETKQTVNDAEIIDINIVETEEESEN